jgi:hypothetical protein
MRSPCENRGRDWSDVATDQGIPKLPEAGNKEGFAPRVFRRDTIFPMP